MSQAVLAALVNDHVEQISCVPNSVNPHSVSSPKANSGPSVRQLIYFMILLVFGATLVAARKA